MSDLSPKRTTYDSRADAAYIRVAGGRMHRTLELVFPFGSVYFDITRGGRVIGIELLGISTLAKRALSAKPTARVRRGGKR